MFRHSKTLMCKYGHRAVSAKQIDMLNDKTVKYKKNSERMMENGGL